MKKNKSKWKELLKKCFGKQKEEQANAIAMLCIFGVFILIVSIFVRTLPSEPNSNQSSSIASPKPTLSPDAAVPTSSPDIKETAELNYSYIFTIVNNGVKEVITGKRLDDKEIFTIIDQQGSKDYARLSNNYLQKLNGNYHIIDTPSENLIYTDVAAMLELAESGTVHSTGNIYTYTVPTSNIVKTFHPDMITSIGETLTDSMIVTFENNITRTIEMNFDHYQKIVSGDNNASLTITLELNDVGTTDDFDVTISN